jgi:glycosyltransferase involved in cell wall biosynthesis
MFFTSSMTTTREGLTSSFHELYIKHLNRPPDPVIMKYFSSRSTEVIDTEVNIYLRQVKEGARSCLRHKVVLAGLIRNAESNISFVMKTYASLKAIFSEIVFLIVENDSSDKTRALLLDWAKIDPSIIILCDHDMTENAPFCEIQGHETFHTDKVPFVRRIKKLSYLRNVYLRYIKNNDRLSLFDYMCVMDLDLSGHLFIDGIYHSFYHMDRESSLSALACNGMVHKKPLSVSTTFEYYDSFAFIELGEPFEWATEFDKFSHDQDVLVYTTKRYTTDMSLDQVNSAFGGFCIYKLQDVLSRNAEYSFSKNNKLSCEHSHFHKNLRKICVNPRMIFLIKANAE